MHREGIGSLPEKATEQANGSFSEESTGTSGFESFPDIPESYEELRPPGPGALCKGCIQVPVHYSDFSIDIRTICFLAQKPAPEDRFQSSPASRRRESCR